MASTYLTRTISTNNPTGRKTMTLSVWLKRATASASNVIFATGTGSERDMILFETDGKIQFSRYDGSYIYHLKTNRQFRDTSAWFHFVFVYDSTQSTSSDRLKIYVNGVQETSFNTASYPSQDYQSNYSQSTYTQTLGRDTDGNFPFDGCMSHVHYVDGTALTPSTFGETDANGVWKIKTSPSVTYGINGFFLLKDNNSANDQSGNGNNFTVAGGTLTNTEDNPSNVFATWNPLVYTDLSFANGNTVATGSSNWGATASTLAPNEGKYYHEVKINTTSNFAILGYIPYEVEMITGTPSGNGDFIGVQTNGTFYTGTGNTASAVPTGSANDIYMFALDLSTPTTGDVYIGKNGTWFNSGNPSTGSNPLVSNYDFTSKTWSAGLWLYDLSVSANFGNGYFGTTAVSSAENPDDGIGIFEYAVPTGYKALCTKSINAQEYD